MINTTSVESVQARREVVEVMCNNNQQGPSNDMPDGGTSGRDRHELMLRSHCRSEAVVRLMLRRLPGVFLEALIDRKPIALSACNQ
jgi:hypothetical protein